VDAFVDALHRHPVPGCGGHPVDGDLVGLLGGSRDVQQPRRATQECIEIGIRAEVDLDPLIGRLLRAFGQHRRPVRGE
jgi:hypothetical protein